VTAEEIAVRRNAMAMAVMRAWLIVVVVVFGLVGCGGQKTVIPTAEFTEEQKAKIKAEDQKVADEESHGAKKR
jgi:hypothetical protein